MRLLCLAAAVSLSTLAPAQLPPTAPASLQAAPSATTDAAPTVAQTLDPSLQTLSSALNTIHTEKWKLSGDLRHRTDENVNSVTQDLNSTLPGLVSAADAPGAPPSTLLDVAQNLTALYEVVLRVSTTGEAFAPRDQQQTLSSALDALSSGRQQLNERLRRAFTNQQTRIGNLQASLNKSAADLAASNAALQQAQSQKNATHATKARPHPTTHKPAVTSPTATPPQ